MTEKLIEQIVKDLKLKDSKAKAFVEHCIELIKLFDRKQTDYGSGNIAAFMDYGVLIRLSDKIERLKNLYKKGISPANESIIDTYSDIAGYALIGLMCLKGEWDDNCQMTKIENS